MGKEFVGFQRGINLGGWLSQYHEATKEHLDTFITREDIDRIARLGCDHVRLPVDYPLLMQYDRDGQVVYSTPGWEYLAECVQWCEMNNLNVVIDLHKAPGYFFNDMDNQLFDEEAYQGQLIDLWQNIAFRYKDHENVAYDLLNEVNGVDPKQWGALAARIISVIRVTGDNHSIIVGSAMQNALAGLEAMGDFPDEKVVYGFHMYDPIFFTHQKASFLPFGRFQKSELHYPSAKSDYNEAMYEMMEGFLPGYSEVAEENDTMLLSHNFNQEYIRQKLQEAELFVQKRKRCVYCGEYGVIQYTDEKSRMNYVKDFNQICDEMNIGRALWNYKELDFGIYDIDKDGVTWETSWREVLCDATT